MIITHTQEIRTKGRSDCIDITPTVEETLRGSKIKQGLATVFVTGSTAGE